MCALTLQEHKVKSQDTADAQVERSTGLDTSRVKFKQLSAEITVWGKQEKIYVNLPKEELDN